MTFEIVSGAVLLAEVEDGAEALDQQL